MSVVTLKYGSHRSYGDRKQGGGGMGTPVRKGRGRVGRGWGTHLNLLVLEDAMDAAVEG